MAKTNTNPTPAEPEVDIDGLWNTSQAAAYLGIQKGSLAAAIERTPYLKDNMITDKYPGLQITRKRLRPQDVKRFAEERKNSPRAASGGMRRWTLLLALDEKPVAEKLLSERFGRDITFDKAYKRKAAETADADGAVGSDAAPGDDNGVYEEEGVLTEA